MSDLNKLFENLVAVSQGNIEALSQATQKFSREVTAPTTLMPRAVTPPPPQPSGEAPQGEQGAA